MKKLIVKLKSISKSLSTLSKQVDKTLAQVEKIKTAKPAPARKKKVAAARKTAAKKKAPAKKKKGAAARKTVAKKKTPAKKAAPKKTAPSKQTTVLDAVFNAIKRSKKGITVAQLKQKTGLNPRQLSNALYKLTKKEMIVAKARGLYVKK